MGRETQRCSLRGASSGSTVILGHIRDDLGLGVVVLVLGLGDLDEVGHDLLDTVSLDAGASHDLHLKTEHSLTKLDGTDSRVNEIGLGLTSGDLITLGVLLGLSTLSTDLTGDHDLATDGTTTAHDGTKDIVSGHTDGSTGEKLELKGLNVGGGTKRSLIGKRLDGELDLVVFVVEAISLLNERFDLLDLTGGLGKKVLALGSANTDLSVGGGGTDLNTGVALNAEGLLEELVELSLEDTIGNELLLGVDSLNSSVFGHFVFVCSCSLVDFLYSSM